MAQVQKAYQKPLLPDSVPAGADLTGKQFYAVKLNSDGEAILATAAGVSDGILETENPNTSSPYGQVVIERAGISYFVAGAACTPDQYLEVGTGGKLVPLAAGKVVAKCVVGAAADLAVGSCQVLPNG